MAAPNRLALEHASSMASGLRHSISSHASPTWPDAARGASRSGSGTDIAIVGSQMNAILERLGRVSLISCSRFDARSTPMWVNSVTFPPGWDRLDTSPDPTGSAANAKTIGIVFVAFMAAKPDWVETAMKTSTVRSTNSLWGAPRIHGELLKLGRKLIHEMSIANARGYSWSATTTS